MANVNDKKWCVYMHTFPNGKRYVGITSMSPEKRFRNGRGYSKQVIMNNAIIKHGWENIITEILYDDVNGGLAKDIEVCLINAYNSNDIKFGYNNTIGGDGVIGYNHTEETKHRISDTLTKTAKRHGHSHKARKVVCLTTCIEFDSIIEAGEHYGIKDVWGICTACKPNLRDRGFSCGEYNGEKLQWSYILEDGTYEKQLSGLVGIGSHKVRGIMCITTTEVFNSISHAVAKYGIPSGNISKCAQGVRQFAGSLPDGTKLVWRYIND
jgi:hypothetical protein